MIAWEPTVLARDLGFPEGPVLDGDGVIVTDIVEARLVRCGTDGDGDVARTRPGPNGAARDANGDLLVATNGGLSVGPGGYWRAAGFGNGAVQRVRPGGTVIDLVTSFPASPPWRPNDLCFGSDGALYVTDPCNWEDLANLRSGRIWRVDPATGDVAQAATVEGFVNGIATGPDGRLYVARSIAQDVIAFDIGSAGLGQPSRFCEVPDAFPDGICFAASGELIVCGSMAHLIAVHGLDGGRIATIPTGADSEPTNCCLGDGVLFVTLSGHGSVVRVPADLGPATASLFR